MSQPTKKPGRSDFEKELKERIVNYLHAKTNLSPSNCYNHGHNIAKLAAKCAAVFGEINDDTELPC